MARKKLIDSDFAISLLEEYRVENPYIKVKVEDIARRANSYGIKIKGYHLRRDEKFMKRFDELSDEVFENEEYKMVAYKSLDVDKLIKNNKGTDALIRTIQQRDDYYKKICLFANKVLIENNDLKRKVSNSKDIKNLEKRISTLEKFINDHINESIAAELLSREGIFEINSSIIKTDSIDIIDSNNKLTHKKLRNLAGMFDDE